MSRTGSGKDHGTMIQAGPPGHEAFRPSAGSSRPVPLQSAAVCCRAQLLQFHVASSELARRTGSTVAAPVDAALRPSCRPCRGWPSKGWPSRGERPAGPPLAATRPSDRPSRSRQLEAPRCPSRVTAAPARRTDAPQASSTDLGAGAPPARAESRQRLAA